MNYSKGKDCLERSRSHSRKINRRQCQNDGQDSPLDIKTGIKEERPVTKGCLASDGGDVAKSYVAGKFIGAHCSIAGGLHRAVEEAVSIGARAFGLFLKSQRSWTAKPLDPKAAAKFKEVCMNAQQNHVYFQKHAGFDLSTEKGYTQFVNDFDRIVGMKYLKAMHLNDSKGAVGCCLDRHENIGKGQIGLEGFKRLMTDPRFDGIPMILETPCSVYNEEIKILNRMAASACK